MFSKYEIEQAEVREKAKVLQGQFDELNEKAVAVDSYLRSVRQYKIQKELREGGEKPAANVWVVVLPVWAHGGCGNLFI